LLQQRITSLRRRNRAPLAQTTQHPVGKESPKRLNSEKKSSYVVRRVEPSCLDTDGIEAETLRQVPKLEETLCMPPY
jgi:hypothetical protein